MVRYETGDYFHVNDTGCQGAKIADAPRNMLGTTSHRIIGAKELFNFAKEGQVQILM